MNDLTNERSRVPTEGATNTLPYDRAWWVLLGACLCMFSGGASVIYYTFGVFLPEVTAETHWSKSAVAAAIGAGTLIACVVVPLTGRATDKFGVRAVALLGGPVFALGLALLGLAPHSAKGFVGYMMLMWALTFAGSPVAYAHALTGWFDKRRGLALSVMFCCGALGIATWPRYAAFLIAYLGWRHAYVVMGASAGTVIFLAGLLFLKSPPAKAPNTDMAAPPSGMPAGGAMRTARFWKLAAIFTILTAVLGGTATEFPVILRQQGADAHTAAAIMSVIGISMFFGRVLLGFVLDRWFAPHITIAITIVPILAFVLMMVGSNKVAFTAAAALIGVGVGSEYAVIAYMVSRAFGFRAYGSIYGLISIATNIGAAIGPAAIGVSLVDGIRGSLIFSSAIALLALAILILLTLGKKDFSFGAVTVLKPIPL